MKQTLEYLESFVVTALIVVGLAGIAYHLFREGGWIGTFTGSFWSYTLRSPVMASVAIAGAMVLGFIWRQNRKAERQETKAAAMVFYLMIAAGAYFMGHVAIRGTL